MTNGKFRVAALAAAFAVLPLSAALADRAPTGEETMIIGDVLLSQGFTEWGKIEYDDDGVWKVDDAVSENGTEYDLELDQAFMIVDDGTDGDDDWDN